MSSQAHFDDWTIPLVHEDLLFFCKAMNLILKRHACATDPLQAAIIGGKSYFWVYMCFIMEALWLNAD